MAKAIVARRDGDTYQARLFWQKASCLLDSKSPIIKVGFEIGPKGFDDIWVEYDKKRAPSDQYGNPLLREHIQCKWHVSPGYYGYSDLVNPDFINASSISLLQRARNAYVDYELNSRSIRFKLVTNWLLEKHDPLTSMIHNRAGTIKVEKLFGTKTDNSAAGRIRKLWREHLSIKDSELQDFAATLAFGSTRELLDDLRDDLDKQFSCVGLRRIPQNESVFLYDDLTFQWLGQGRLEFDDQTFRRKCEDEGLFEEVKNEKIVFGVKSFEHAFDRLEDRCVKTLDLVPYFYERLICQQDDWEKELYPQLDDFLVKAAKSNDCFRLAIDAHSTLAFAAGSILNVKSGRTIELEQRTINRSVWHPDDSEEDVDWAVWNFNFQFLNTKGNGIAIAVGLTHDIELAVTNYIEKYLPTVNQLLVAKLSSGAGIRSVVNGRHAFDLAEKLARKINEKKDGAGIHVFVSAPNAFTFFLGQQQPSLGKVTLYEYDFENQDDGTYRPSLSLPV